MGGVRVKNKKIKNNLTVCLDRMDGLGYRVIVNGRLLGQLDVLGRFEKGLLVMDKERLSFWLNKGVKINDRLKKLLLV